MIVQHGFERPENYRGGCLSIGNFDGVHRGHQQILAELTDLAGQGGKPAVVMTFDPPPIALLTPQAAPPRLSSLSWKAELLERCRIDCLVVYPTTPELLSMNAQDFFSQIIESEFQAQGIVEGPNFCFGKDRSGTVDTLRQLCDSSDLTLKIVEPAKWHGQIVSSSRIREELIHGRLANAVDMLGHPYRLAGHVQTGSHRGRRLGFPTANLGGVSTLIPRRGVYAGLVRLDQQRYAAAVHIGTNPTFSETTEKVEIHLIGFDGDLYGRELKVDLYQDVRMTQTFDDAETLRQQLLSDVQVISKLMAPYLESTSRTTET